MNTRPAAGKVISGFTSSVAPFSMRLLLVFLEPLPIHCLNIGHVLPGLEGVVYHEERLASRKTYQRKHTHTHHKTPKRTHPANEREQEKDKEEDGKRKRRRKGQERRRTGGRKRAGRGKRERVK